MPLHIDDQNLVKDSVTALIAAMFLARVIDGPELMRIFTTSIDDTTNGYLDGAVKLARALVDTVDEAALLDETTRAEALKK